VGVGTRFVFTAVSPMGSPENNTSMILRTYLKFMSEPLAWMMLTKDMPAFVTKQNYSIDKTADDAQIMKALQADPTIQKLHQGEYCISTTAL
jgi:hypothetical protein